ncbi:cation:proton antiporter subunit C [Methanospirillum purgamenti]|uniref:Cation:proton antiporter subunit C n=1 Tax=Methanospirillum hungatei TaxID=2203 RepID=A0A8F5VN07_METHU|nr:cation:proton antiporter subunit C [Methanospirillum hungatei]QXO96076.1 cation:proton antiporter subunit C [Methanospirillum hungatei]
MIDNLPFLVVAITILLGLYTILLKKDLIKIIMGISLIESGVNLFLIALGYRWDRIAPIFTGAPSLAMVMPTVQALTLTSIVIGVATLALLLSMVMIIYRYYRTTDVREVSKLQG